MNALQHSTEFIRLESDLAARLETLFQRCPALHGFSVQAGSSVTRERVVVGLQEDQPLNGEQAATLVGEISQALLELVDEQPDAIELLRGRTFASVLH